MLGLRVLFGVYFTSPEALGEILSTQKEKENVDDFGGGTQTVFNLKH